MNVWKVLRNLVWSQDGRTWRWRENTRWRKEKRLAGESLFQNLVTGGLRFHWSRVENMLFCNVLAVWQDQSAAGSLPPHVKRALWSFFFFLLLLFLKRLMKVTCNLPHWLSQTHTIHSAQPMQIEKCVYVSHYPWCTEPCKAQRREKKLKDCQRQMNARLTANEIMMSFSHYCSTFVFLDQSRGRLVS